MLVLRQLEYRSLVAGRTRQRRFDVAAASAAARADARLAEQQVGDDADDRQDQDDDDPGEPRRGLAVRADQRTKENRDFGGDEEDLGGRREGGRLYQPLLSPVRRSVRPPNSPPLSQR
jgi:hypothetical protein